jgi:hypothetical protein
LRVALSMTQRFLLGFFYVSAVVKPTTSG